MDGQTSPLLLVQREIKRWICYMLYHHHKPKKARERCLLLASRTYTTDEYCSELTYNATKLSLWSKKSNSLWEVMSVRLSVCDPGRCYTTNLSLSLHCRGNAFAAGITFPWKYTFLLQPLPINWRVFCPFLVAHHKIYIYVVISYKVPLKSQSEWNLVVTSRSAKIEMSKLKHKEENKAKVQWNSPSLHT